jgi:hypothetical protein
MRNESSFWIRVRDVAYGTVKESWGGTRVLWPCGGRVLGETEAGEVAR